MTPTLGVHSFADSLASQLISFEVWRNKTLVRRVPVSERHGAGEFGRPLPPKRFDSRPLKSRLNLKLAFDPKVRPLLV